MRIAVTALHVWKVWVGYDATAEVGARHVLHVLAESASRAAEIAEAWWREDGLEGGVAVHVCLMGGHVVWEPDRVDKELLGEGE